jgi:hypothetical protein
LLKQRQTPLILFQRLVFDDAYRVLGYLFLFVYYNSYHLFNLFQLPIFPKIRCDDEISDISHKKVMKSVCYDYEEVSAIENENVGKLIDSAFMEQCKLIYKVS